MSTLRFVLPQWQGGLNPNYVLGSELLAIIAPPSARDEVVTIKVNRDFDAPLKTEHGVDRFGDLMAQTDACLAVLAEKNPDKIITFGGDCSISQAPFAYLSEKYGDKLGVLWLDAHPDIATVDQSSHLHEMVLGNLIGEGAPAFAAKLKSSIKPSHVFYAGLIEKDLRPMDDGVFRHNIGFATPEDLNTDSQKILDWIADEKIEVLAVHFDLDVLSPRDFRSIYPAEPYTNVADFPAAVGELTLKKVVSILNELEEVVDLVGLSLAEYLPWDALHLRTALSHISIFND
ncbi:arginase family protein [Streptococcus mutans]|uniref:arginase family protein n=2 Tax=Streptococcus mutans TaxID=1309 RepID=UPI0002B5D777|nr:arginase family protein [Streptococcus mutans]EMC50910.1 arginase [Streptococcus mutans SA41]MCB5025024.1 arginase family protein [Streptococcus mutans]